MPFLPEVILSLLANFAHIFTAPTWRYAQTFLSNSILCNGKRTGVRISELINIKWLDIEEYYNSIHGHIITILVNGKGGKQCYTYLLQDEVEDNLDYIRQKNCWFWFITTPCI